MGPQAGIFLEQLLVVALGLKPSYSVSKRVVGFPARLSYFHTGLC